MVFIILIILFFTIQFLVKQFYLSDITPVYHLPTIKSIDSLSIGNNKNSVFNSKSNVSFKLQSFDPNLVSESELITLGIKPYFAKRILKYREKGGKFKIKKDLLKIYGFPKDDFKRLQSYISLPDTTAKFSYSHDEKKNLVIEKKVLDLNKIDSAALERLPGIGEVLASRIIKYKNKLGGFTDKNQLKEVYGLTEETFIKIQELIELNKTEIIQLQINKLSIKELGTHPYIGYKNAKLIIAYRNQHGVFNSIKDLFYVKELDMEKINKVIPYLNFQ